MLNLVEEVVVEDAGQSVEEVQSYILMGDAKDEDAEEVRFAGPGRGGLGGSSTAGGGRGVKWQRRLVAEHEPLDIKVLRKWVSFGRTRKCCYIFIDKNVNVIV
ncbi:hypothetical protein CTI12_AA246450 [Artemisia annua]|uniref:Uncharacterized protein n=1 Tax=Artemisia annua TaxID=35608 RepID=A0A2U1NN95_ARTAN|nr:hypothetical protein CTI12_AA246450 [Artemisia annua]